MTSTGSRRCRLAIARIGARHRRREERGLSRRRHRVENRLEIFGEAHVEHLVGFVEHDHLHGVERERAATDVIERAARRRDDDVDAALERAELLLHRLAAVDRQHAHAELASVVVHRLGDLHGELARRHEDQAADDARVVVRRRRCGAAAAARTPRSCRCRSRPDRARRGRRGAAEWLRAECRSALRSRARSTAATSAGSRPRARNALAAGSAGAGR